MPKRRKVPWPIMKTQLTKECRDRFGRHSCGRRGAHSAQGTVAQAICNRIVAKVFRRRRASFENIRAPVNLSAPSRSNGRIETLFKIQLIKFNLMVPAEREPTSVSRLRRSRESQVRSHVQNVRKSRYRIVPDPDPACRFICARRTRRRTRRFGGNGRISATGWFGGNGKCADQRYCAGPGKRRRNEQCGGRSQRRGQRFQDSSAPAAEHSRAYDSAVQVMRKVFAENSPGVGRKS